MIRIGVYIVLNRVIILLLDLASGIITPVICGGNSPHIASCPSDTQPKVYRLMSLQIASVIVFDIKGYLLYLSYVYDLHRTVVHFYFHHLGFSISHSYGC